MELKAIKDASTAELVAFYNTHIVRLQDGKVIKKFESRAKAEEKCDKLGERLESYLAATEPGTYPPEGMIIIGALTTDDGEVIEVKASEVAPVAKIINGDEEPEEDDEPAVNSFGAMGATLNATGKKAEPTRTTGRPSNSAGVAKSWTVDDVRTRRLTRDSVVVTVDGVAHEFKSSHDAFRAFRLPESKHIRFRLRLKALRTETFVDGAKSYVFQIVEKTVE